MQISADERNRRKSIAATRLNGDINRVSELAAQRGYLCSRCGYRNIGIRNRMTDLPADPLRHRMARTVTLPEDRNKLLGADII